MLWTPVFPRRILSDSPGQRRPDLLGPEVSLFFFSASDTHSRTGRESSSYKTRERERERNGSCQFSSFNWDFAALSVTKSLRGQHQTKEKTFHILLSFTTESSYLFLPLSIFFFMDFSHILPTYPSLGLCSPLFLCFKKFDISTTQHKKHTKMKIKAETQKPQSRRHFETVRDQLYYAEEKDHTSRRTSRPHPERTRMYRIKKYSTNYIHIISIG